MMVSLSRMPSPAKTYTADFPKLTGGLNLWELDYRMGAHQSPNMKNLWWQDGVLQCRDGQVFCWEERLGTGWACAQSLFWDYAFFHIGEGLYCADPAQPDLTLIKLGEGVPQCRGSFFRYQDWLFYKNRGGFFRLSYQPEEEIPFLMEDMTALAYVPVIAINASPADGAGEVYQPENRLSGAKTVRYNAEEGVKVYHLPVTAIDEVLSVYVDGKLLESGTDYAVNLTDGLVSFVEAPPVTNPATNNTVEITYRKENPAALSSVMDCDRAVVAGGESELCILLAGCPAQPNAIFWNSNDNLSMNPGYFPMTCYNLVGDTQDPVTGFGRQYGDVMVFQTHAIGKLGFTVEEVDGRHTVSFPYTAVNARVGCDLPYSIQLIENNLVFCNTYQGVHIIRSSSAAYENNVQCISRNVNGRSGLGLLHDVRAGAVVTSFDDDDHYWLCANGNVYLWDYALSGFSDPSWFFFTDIHGVAYFQDGEHRRYHLDGEGRVTRFGRVFSDYDRAIHKLYQFPTQHFGDYDRLKDVTDVLITVRSDTDADVTIRYDTDYEKREDRTPIRSYSWRLSPRNLTRRCLGVNRYAHVVRRRPGCRHIRHFSMTFSNDQPGSDLAVVSARILYKFQGKER